MTAEQHQSECCTWQALRLTRWLGSPEWNVCAMASIQGGTSAPQPVQRSSLSTSHARMVGSSRYRRPLTAPQGQYWVSANTSGQGQGQGSGSVARVNALMPELVS